MMRFARRGVRHWRGVGSNEIRTRKSSNGGSLNRQRHVRRMRKRATDTLRGHRETSSRRGCGRSKIDHRIDPGSHRERTGRIGSDPNRQTSERYLNTAAKTIVRNNRKVYRRADTALRNTYDIGANRNREICRLWLLNEGSRAPATSSTNLSNQKNDNSARYTLNEPSQGVAPTNMAANTAAMGRNRNDGTVQLRIILINTMAESFAKQGLLMPCLDRCWTA